MSHRKRLYAGATALVMISLLVAGVVGIGLILYHIAVLLSGPATYVGSVIMSQYVRELSMIIVGIMVFLILSYLLGILITGDSE